MKVHAVLPELFAVIGGDDHHRAVEDPPPTQRLEQAGELIVQVGDCPVIRVHLFPNLGRRDPLGELRGPVAPKRTEPIGARGAREAFEVRRGRQVRVVRIEVVEKGKEGPTPRRLLPGQKVVGEPGRVLEAELGVRAHQRAQAPRVGEPPAERRAADHFAGRDAIVLVMEESSSEPVLARSVRSIGDEPRRQVPSSAKALGEYRLRVVQRREPVG